MNADGSCPDGSGLRRFLEAQQGTHAAALSEIGAGRKTTHWMWFVFPQLAGLGQSPMARRYAIRSLREARNYLAHPVLGARLRECVGALQALGETTAEDVFGPVDAMKLRSSLTLFAEAAPAEPLFAAALARWFPKGKDRQTLDLLAA